MEPDNDKTRSHIALTKGTMVSHYRIIEKIGAGGMGEVYLAEDTELDRKVALKFLPSHLCQDEDCRKRFKREAQAAAKLDHPNIVPVHEVGEYKSRPFFAMAHIKGKSLRDVIRESKLTVTDAVELTMQICEGLHKAHESGVIHRDIKPGNIIIDEENRPRIVDFGLATVSGEEKLTKTGSTLGTVGYMSPEQIEGKQVDHRSDLFSVGVILYEMLTGHRPFEGDNDAAVARSITDTSPEPIARFKSGTTGELQQIVDKALSKDPSLRYQHADGMLADLKRLQIETGTKAKSKPGLWAALFVILIAIIGYLFLDRFQDSAKDDGTGWDNSVAVLVFRNLSGDEDQDIFCEGMTDEIIGRLSTIKNLKVTSMQSMLRFKGTELDLKDIGKELKVDNILEGSIQRSGDSIRVRAQLIRVEDDAHIWTERYDRELKSVFAIQDDISIAIAEVLKATLVDTEESFTARHGTDNIEAYNAYIRGRHFWRKRTQEGLTTAIEHFENAVVIDPNYAVGWSGLADGWSMLARYAYLDHLTGYAKADTASRIAVDLDPNLAEAHTSRGWVLYLQSNYDEAEKHFLKAIELNPSYPWAHVWYNSVLGALGRNEEMLAHEQIAYELDPLSPAILHSRAIRSRRAGDVGNAIKYSKIVLELEPDHAGSYVRLTQVYLDSKDSIKALETAEQMIEQIPDNYKSYTTRGGLFWQLGRMDEAQAEYEKAIETEPDNWAPYQAYAGYLQNGRRDYQEALKYIEKAVELDSLQAGVISHYGHLLRMVGRTDEAIEQCEKVMELAPYDPESFRAYGWVIGNGQSRFEDAIEYMQKALELNPRHGSTLHSISLMYSNIGMTNEALSAINRRIELDKSFADAFLRKADICLVGGLLDSALVSYRQFNELRPYYTDAIVSIGDLATILGHYKEADSIYATLVERPDPAQRAEGRIYGVRPLVHQGKFREALTFLQNAIDIDRSEPGNTQALFEKTIMKGSIYHLFLDNPDSALAEFERARGMTDSLKTYVSFWTASTDGLIAEVMAEKGDIEEAEFYLMDAIGRIDPSNTWTLESMNTHRARILRLAGKDAEAAELLETVRRERKNFYFDYCLGLCYLGAGDNSRATEIFEQAIQSFDGSYFSSWGETVLVHYYLGCAYEAVGRTEEAIEQYEIFLDIWKNADKGLKLVEDARQRLAKL